MTDFSHLLFFSFSWKRPSCSIIIGARQHASRNVHLRLYYSFLSSFFFFLEKSFLARKKALFVESLARISLLLLGDVQRRRYTRAQKRAYTRAAPAACSVVGHETTPRQWSVLTKFVCRALHIRSKNSTVFSYLPLSSLTVRRIKLKQGVKSCVNGGIKCVSCF